MTVNILLSVNLDKSTFNLTKPSRSSRRNSLKLFVLFQPQAGVRSLRLVKIQTNALTALPLDDAVAMGKPASTLSAVTCALAGMKTTTEV